MARPPHALPSPRRGWRRVRTRAWRRRRRDVSRQQQECGFVGGVFEDQGRGSAEVGGRRGVA